VGISGPYVKFDRKVKKLHNYKIECLKIAK
jgi:hypothetical protein